MSTFSNLSRIVIIVAILAASSLAGDCGSVCSTPADCNGAGCNICMGLVPSGSWSGSQDDGRCGGQGPSPPSGGCYEYCSSNSDCYEPSCPFCNTQASASGSVCTAWPPSCGSTCLTSADCHKDCLLCSGTVNQPGYCYSNTSKCFGPCQTDNDCAGGQCTHCNNVTNTCVLPSFCGTQCSEDSECSPIYGECSTCDVPFASSWGTCVHSNETVPPGCHQPCKSSADCAKEGSCPFCWGGMCHKPPKCGQTCYSSSDCSQYGYCEACSYNQSDASSATGSSGPGKCYNPWHPDV